MAEEEEGVEEEAGGGKKKLIIMIVAAVLLIGGGVGGAMMFMGGDEEVASEEGAEGEEEVLKEALYIPLQPVFVINYQDANGNTRFLKTEVSLMTHSAENIEAIEKHIPKLKHLLNGVFGKQEFTDLQTAEGKEKVREEAIAALQGMLNEAVGEDNISDIYFTQFVTQ